MMMIGMLMTWWWWSMFFISLPQSLNRSLSLNRSFSFSLTCRFFRLLDRPSDDHCCPMTGKQFRGSCSFDTAATLMLLLPLILCSLSLTQVRNHDFWQSIGSSLLSHDRLAIPMLIRMMMIGMLMTWWWWSMFFHLTHSITHTLSHYLLQSLSFFLSLLCFALTLSYSLSHL